MASNRKMDAVEILFDGASGQYIPQRFAEECTGPQWHNVSEHDRAILAAGPEHDLYWEAWATVLDNAEFHANDGAVYRLHQDDDVFVYCLERMTPDEQINLFGEYSPLDD